VDYLVARGTVRLTVAPAGTALPPRIRISLDQKDLPSGIAPGAEIRVKAQIAPPPPMALPGTYDFARDAWFQGIGGVGKALGTVTVVKPAQPHGLERPEAASVSTSRRGCRRAQQESPSLWSLATRMPSTRTTRMRCGAAASRICCR
jgi:predicted membrane metal-binding protein